MVGFISQLPIEEDSDNVSNIKTFKDPLDSLDLKINDLSFADSFLDFDSIKEWFEDKSIVESESRVLDRSMELDKEQCFEGMPTGNQIRPGLEPNVNESKPTISESEQNVGGSESTGILCAPIVDVLKVKVEKEVLNSDTDIRACVENEMRKVRLVDGQEISILNRSYGDSVNCSGDGDNRSSCLEESESEGSLSSSSSSSSSDDDEGDDSSDNEEEGNDNRKKVQLKMVGKREIDEMDNLEEGEIRDGYDTEIACANDHGDSDDEGEEDGEDTDFGHCIELDDADAEEAVGVPKGPIRSKNELEQLPPVPSVGVVLHQHHQMQPVGVILSVMGAKVIVEGREKHNPLNEGSILWITENRQPLGLVDEIFGPVKNPYYVVRYNSEAEIPLGIHEGALVSFVPEFADHVLNDKSLYKKGYDASGENDEEVSYDEEFSDDEKEAEYKKMQKLVKRGMNDQRPGSRKNNKKVHHKGGSWKNNRNPAEMKQTAVGEVPANGNRYSDAMEPGNSHQNSQSAMRQSFVGGAVLVPPLPVMQQSTGFAAAPTGAEMWINQIPGQELQTPIYQSGFPNGAIPLPNNQQHSYTFPMPIPNAMFMSFQQQMFGPNHYSLPNVALPGGQPNFSPSSTWMGNAGQGGFNQSMSAVSLQGQQPTVNVVQGTLPNLQQPSVLPSNFGASQQFHTDTPSGHGRKSFRGSRFSGGRGMRSFK